MPKRKEPELDPKEQFKRFQEAAKEHEIEDGILEREFQKLRAGSVNRSPRNYKKDGK